MNQDSDGDGLSDWNEIMAGSNPGDTASGFAAQWDDIPEVINESGYNHSYHPALSFNQAGDKVLVFDSGGDIYFSFLDSSDTEWTEPSKIFDDTNCLKPDV